MDVATAWRTTVEQALEGVRRCYERAGEIRTLRLPNGRVALEVQDDGPGIPRKNRRTIFRPFRRGCSIDSQPAGGIGLGLALAKRWARLLDGHLELVTPDHTRGGACFRFTFPK